MPAPVVLHIAALQAQFRKVRMVAFIACSVTLVAGLVLYRPLQPDWLQVVFFIAVLFYALRKGLLSFRTHQAVKQLRLEQQFVQHGPSPLHITPCLRHRQHLWHNSMIMKALESFLARPSIFIDERTKTHHLQERFQDSIHSLRPVQIPTDLIWLFSILMLWLGAVPGSLAQTSPLSILAALGLFVALLLAELYQTVLCFGLHDGFSDLVHHLTRWTLARKFEEKMLSPTRKYRHVLLYRAPALLISPKRAPSPLRKVV